MPSVFHHELVVSRGDIDRLGHVNNLSYLAWLQDAAVAHSDVQGWPHEQYERIGATWVVRSHQIRYLRPAFDGERLIVVTWIGAAGRASSTRRYKIVRPEDETLLARAETHWAFVSLETGSPVRVPEEVARSFIVTEEPELFGGAK